MTAARRAAAAADVAIVGSLLDNVPNMAGLVRTSEALLGTLAEVTLRTDKVLLDPQFLKSETAPTQTRATQIIATQTRATQTQTRATHTAWLQTARLQTRRSPRQLAPPPPGRKCRWQRRGVAL